MDNPLRWLALVLLGQPQLPAFDALSGALAQHFNDTPQAAGSTDKLLTLTLGDDTAAITLVDRPVPWSQLKGPCATAWYWPEAAEVLRPHQAHLLVTLVDEGGQTLEKSTLLTKLVTAAVQHTPACGVFWGPGRLVHPVPAFVDQAVQLTEEDLPLFLWVDFRVERLAADSLRLYTTGLEALGYTELEIAHFSGEAQQMLTFAYNIAHYQITQPKPINTGDTLGLTDQLQAVVHRQPSMFNAEMEVIALEFEAIG